MQLSWLKYGWSNLNFFIQCYRTNKILLKQYECPVIAPHVQIHILAGGERCYSKFRNCMAPTLTVGLSLYCMHPSTCTITCIFYLTLQSVVSSNILEDLGLKIWYVQKCCFYKCVIVWQTENIVQRLYQHSSTISNVIMIHCA